MNCVLLASLSLLLLAGFPREADCSTAEEREEVVRYLLRDNNRLVRPDGAGGGGTPVTVSVSFSDTRILDVDEERGLVKIAGYLIVTWTDPRLAFQSMLRGFPQDVHTVRLDSSYIWVPDIELFNTDSPGLQSLSGKYLVVAASDGRMTWVPQVTYNAFCEPLELVNSFDAEPHGLNCTMKFGSWSYPGDDVDLQVTEVPDLKWKSAIQHWRVASSSVKREVKRYDCCPEDYVTATYSFQLVRH